MALLAGTHTHYDNSMAQAIEKAFLAEWPNVIPGQPVPESNDQMRLLFMAIAQGVVHHLVKNPGAFTLTVRDLGSQALPASLTISQDNNFTTLP